MDSSKFKERVRGIAIEMCFATGINTAHDYDGVETDEDVILYLNAALKLLRDSKDTKVCARAQRGANDAR